MTCFTVTSYNEPNQDKKTQFERQQLISASQPVITEYFQRIRGDQDPHRPSSSAKVYTLEEACENSQKMHALAEQIWNYCKTEYDHDLSAEYDPTPISLKKLGTLRATDAAKTLEGLFFYFTKAQYAIDEYRVKLKKDYDNPFLRKPFKFLLLISATYTALSKIKFLNKRISLLKPKTAPIITYITGFLWLCYEADVKISGYNIKSFKIPEIKAPSEDSDTLGEVVNLEKISAQRFVEKRRELLFNELKELFTKRPDNKPPAYELPPSEMQEPSAPPQEV